MFTVKVPVKDVIVTSDFPWPMGIVLFMAFPETTNNVGVEKAVKAIVEDYFFDEFEIHIVPKEIWNNIVKILEEREIIVGAALQLHIFKEKLDINSLNEELRRKSVNRLKELIEEAHARGLSKVGLCSGPDPGPEKRSEAKKKLIESLKELCEFSKERGITLLFETFDREYDKKLLIGPLPEAAEVLEEVRKEYSNIGLMWDLSHAPLLDEKPEDLLKYKDLLAHIHVGCAKVKDGKKLDTHPVFHTKGAINTEEDVKRLIKVLKEIGYRGIVTLEIKPEEHQTSLEIINVAKGVMLKAYSMFLREYFT